MRQMDDSVAASAGHKPTLSCTNVDEPARSKDPLLARPSPAMLSLRMRFFCILPRCPILVSLNAFSIVHNSQI